MENGRRIYKIVCLIIISMFLFLGCQSSEMDNKVGFVACDYAMEQEEYINYLMDMEVDDVTLVMYTPCFYSDDGVKELNRLLQKKDYTFQIEIRQIPDSYACSFEQLAYDLQEKGIRADIFGYYSDNLIAAAEQGIFLDLNQYLNTESGQVLKTYLPQQYWELSELDGRQYFIGFLDAPETAGWAANQELMEKYGFSEEDLAKPLEDLEDVFQKVWEGEKDDPRYQVKLDNGQVIIDFSVFTMVPYNLDYSLPFCFVDETLPVGIWMEEDSSDKNKIEIKNLFDTDRMHNLVKSLNSYYQKGYVKNSETGLAGSRNFFMQPDFNGYPIQRKDSLDTWTNQNGIVLKRIPYYKRDINSITTMGNAILQSSSYQNESFEFLSFVFTDQSASDLLFYGKEDVDYERTEDGRIDAGNSIGENYRQKSMGNLRISSPVFPYEDNDKGELLEKDLNSVKKYFPEGFFFDETPVQKQVDAVRQLYLNVNHFQNMFMFEKYSGIEESNWEEYYANYCSELKVAGIDDVVKEMNRQLENYLNKK